MDSRVDRFFHGIKGKKISVIGIGVSHSDLISRLNDYGAKVTAHDRRTREEVGEAICNNFEARGVKLRLGEDYLENIDADIVLRTPGMKFHHPVLERLRRDGVAVTSEMELFFDLCPCKTIGITGSDGKTTTTTLITEILKEAGRRVHVGGNIGRALMPLIRDIREGDFAVAELSSFQLISMRESPDIAVVTNITPNHLDVHKDMQEYIDAKKNIVLHQNAFSRTVLNLDNEISNSFSEYVRGTLYKFSRRNSVRSGAYMKSNGEIVMSINGEETHIMKAEEIKIPGLHNIENYLAAISAVWGLVDVETIRKVAMEFAGVEHRAELVRELDGVRWYNDAIGTSPTRTVKGTLSLYDRKIILIAGGYDKKIPYDEMGEVVPKTVKLLILMGATADKIEEATRKASTYSEGNPEIIRVNSMEEAVKIARERAESGDIVSMSPASASFDMYKNFAEKGLHYKRLVMEL